MLRHTRLKAGCRQADSLSYAKRASWFVYQLEKHLAVKIVD
jgi:hypothetical protein